MDSLGGGLLSVDSKVALNFFFQRLKEVSEPIDDNTELMYNASILAHYAQVSRCADSEWPAPADLSTVFNNFVYDSTFPHGVKILETAGAQCLLLAGFFEDQMPKRHSIQWYAQLGSGFFNRAAALESHSHKAQLLNSLARRFELWRQRQAKLSRELRDSPYLIHPPIKPS
jgi:hypothetical protein